MTTGSGPTTNRGLRASTGQSLIEFAMILPLVLVIVMGVIEVGYALLDEHGVTKLTREGSNMISRDTSLQDASAALKSMTTRSLDFDTGARMIFSVIKMGATSGTSNFNKEILYQRYEYGALSATSTLNTKGPGAFGGAPDYQAANSDNDTNLQVTNLPPNLVGTGGMIYVTEIYTKHTLITPFDRLGIKIPTTLYSIAYF
jgi:Flp pilus assembly protein TadG